MPQPYKGRRIALTVRLPVDLYTEASRMAARRQWSLSHFVAYCVAREAKAGSKKSRPAITGAQLRREAESG